MPLLGILGEGIRKHRDLLFGGVIVGTVGIIFGWLSGRTIEKKIDRVMEAASTRYVSKFPGYLPSVTNLVKNRAENDELLIMVDFLGAGHYSSPESYEKYVKALIASAARKGKKISILIFSKTDARREIEDQFQKWKNDITKADNYQNYWGSYPELTPTTDYYSFLRTLLAEQNVFCNQLGSHAPAIEIRTIPPANNETSVREAFWYWLIPDKEMIFAAPQSVTGYAFHTQDPQLMSLFENRFREEWNRNGEHITGNCYKPEEVIPEGFKTPAAQ